MTKEETMKIINEGNVEAICPVVDKIAELTDRGFEIAADSVFERDEDEVIFELILSFYSRGMYMEAVDILALTFSLIGAEESFMLVALIGSCGRDEVFKQFLTSFLEYSERCEIENIKIYGIN